MRDLANHEVWSFYLFLQFGWGADRDGGTYVDHQVFYRETRLGALLDFQPILVLVPEEHIRNIPRGILTPVFVFHSDYPRVHAGFNHIGLDHCNCLFRHLVRVHVNRTVFRTGQYGCDHTRSEQAGGRRPRWGRVVQLDSRRKDRFQRG